VRRLVPLAVLAVLGVACSVPGGKVSAPTPETVVGSVPVATTPEVPPEYASGDPAAGKEVYAQSGCGACHTLADAGSTGTIGPNLDQAKPPLPLAVDRIVNGRGGMPSFKGQLQAQQIADVAAYVVGATQG
jgi:mono/diheme cytochrome c family protein